MFSGLRKFQRNGAIRVSQFKLATKGNANMKKALFVIVLASLALGLAACGKKDPVVQEAEFGKHLEDKAQGVVDEYNSQFENTDNFVSTEEEEHFEE